VTHRILTSALVQVRADDLGTGHGVPSRVYPVDDVSTAGDPVVDSREPWPQPAV